MPIEAAILAEPQRPGVRKGRWHIARVLRRLDPGSRNGREFAKAVDTWRVGTSGNLAFAAGLGWFRANAAERCGLPGQPGFRSVEERPGELSAQGDPPEKLLEVVDFELSRAALNDAVSRLKMLYLLAQHGPSLEARERLVRDRLSWMRLCGLSIADPVPDASALWDFREALIRAGALSGLSGQLDRTIKEAGWRWAVGSSMRAWWQPRGSATPRPGRPRSAPASSTSSPGRRTG